MSLPIEKLQVGDILLKKGTAIGALAIRELTADGVPFDLSYSHCGIYAGDGKVWDARIPDIDVRPLDYEDFDVYRVKMTDEQRAKLFDFCASERGVHYATEGVAEAGIERIFHIPLHIDLHGEEWCATFVAHTFAAAGILLTRKPLPTPNDIAWSPVPQQVTELAA